MTQHMEIIGTVVQARDLPTNVFLPGLDNGYVTEIENNDDGYFSYPGRNTYSVAMPQDTVLITYHDRDGEECYLLLPGGSLICYKEN